MASGGEPVVVDAGSDVDATVPDSDTAATVAETELDSSSRSVAATELDSTSADETPMADTVMYAANPQSGPEAPLPDTVFYVADFEPEEEPAIARWRDRALAPPQRALSRSRSPPVVLPLRQQRPPLSLAEVAELARRLPGEPRREARSSPHPLAMRLGRDALSRGVSPGRLQWRAVDGDSVSFEAAAEHAVGVISQSIASGAAGSFYVGITGDPSGRWLGREGFSGHIRDFDAMLIVFVARSCTSTARMEQRLISRFDGHAGLRNASGGGERAYGTPHYTYVAVRQNALIRR